MDQNRIDQAKRELRDLTGPYSDGNVDAVKKVLDEFPFLINEVSMFISLHSIIISKIYLIDLSTIARLGHVLSHGISRSFVFSSCSTC